MNLMPRPVQIACVILMVLMTFILAFIVPLYSHAGKTYQRARRLLTTGTILIAILYLIQILFQKNIGDHGFTRMILNLMFGIPIGFLVNMSLIYLQKRGRIQKREWITLPVFYLLTTGILIFCLLNNRWKKGLEIATLVATLVYGGCLIYCSILQIMEYIRIDKSIRRHNNKTYQPLVRWTKWSMILLVSVSLGFPIVVCCHSTLCRSLYSLLSLLAATSYMTGFICYGLCSRKRHLKSSNSVRTNSTSPVDKNSKKPVTGRPLDKKEEAPVTGEKPLPQLNALKAKQMEEAVKHFMETEGYTNPGLTMKKAAEQMGVNCNMLKIWLRDSPYGKYNNWISTLRLEKAKDMLLNMPGTSNETIAEKCGFCDRQYFQNLFRKKEGISPYKWATNKIREKNSNVENNRQNETEE